jgi:hypothetical protein
MSVDPKDLAQYQGAKVVVVVRKADHNEEVEGTVETVSALAILVKPKGRTNMEIVEVGEIEEISFAPEKAKELKTKRLANLKFGQARQHLLDRHGETVSTINEMTEEQAWEVHNGIDHIEEDLGHWHGEKDEKLPEPDEAEEADESDEDSDEDDEPEF